MSEQPVIVPERRRVGGKRPQSRFIVLDPGPM